MVSKLNSELANPSSVAILEVLCFYLLSPGIINELPCSLCFEMDSGIQILFFMLE